MLNMIDYFVNSTIKQHFHQRTYESALLWRIGAQIPRKHVGFAAVEQLVGVEGREGQALVEDACVHVSAVKI
jgi:hypothetical protein